MKKYTLSKDITMAKLDLLGRYYLQDNLLNMDFSGSGFSLSFKGTYLKLIVVATNFENENRPYLEICVDNEKPYKIGLFCKENELEIVKNKENSIHKVTIIKVTESSISHVGYSYLECDGELLEKEKDNKLKIEIFGDSITCGYAIEAKEVDTPFDSKYENYYLAYPSLLQQLFPCYINSVCAGGFPLYKSTYTAWSKIKTIPEMFTIASFDGSKDVNSSPKWDCSKFIPDVVILNLGANDRSVGEKSFQTNEFKNALASFIKLLISTYGKQLKIIMMSGMVPLPSYIENPIDEVICKEDNPLIYRFKSESFNVGGIMPGYGHPNYNVHVKAASELASLIRRII